MNSFGDTNVVDLAGCVADRSAPDNDGWTGELDKGDCVRE